ncbi:MAG: hypothetical protein H6726_19075 [Sandaracinaceae bacterium]|nr:hypothetical protein [Sandaracinaceae bacterium]
MEAAELLLTDESVDVSDARGLLARGCEGGVPRACALEGDLLSRRLDQEELAIERYRVACTASATDGCAGLVHLCVRGRLAACERMAESCESGADGECAAEGAR